MDFVGGDDTVEVGVDLAADYRVGEPLVVEVAEIRGRFLVAGIGRISPTPGVHVQRKPDLGVRVELVNDVIGLRVGGRLVAQADRHQVGPDHGRREVRRERNGEVRRQHRVNGFVEHHPVGDLIGVLPREVGRVLLELGHRRRRDPAAAGLRGQTEEFLDTGLGGVVHPQRQGEVVDGDHRIKPGRVHGSQLVGVVGDLILIGHRIELRQHLRGEAVRDVHRFSRIGEDPAPFDAHPERVGADALAG